MPTLLDQNKFCENLEEVTSPNIVTKRKFHPEGLFSEQIFGPLKNYTCQCGIYYGSSKSGGKCKTCKVDIVNNNVRRQRFAKIVLPIPVVNPIFYDLLISIGGNNVKSMIDTLMKKDDVSLYKDGDDYVCVEDKNVPEKAKRWEMLEAIHELVSGLTNDNIKHGNTNWKIIKDNLHLLFLNNVIVLPPDLRPAAKGIERNNQVIDKINRYYVQILTKKEAMRNTSFSISKDKRIFYTYFKQIQKDVNELYEHIIEKLSKKEGLIRGNILGKRIDFSGRAVIIPDPTLSLDECCLPYVMILELFKLKISKILIELGKFKLLNDAVDFIDNCIDFKIPSLYRIAEEAIENEFCLLNRQPSLHRLSMIGFKIKMSMDNVIKIHPLVCSGFNADFDGDQMAVYIPVSDEAKEEVKKKFLSTKNLSNPANESLTTVPSQDIVLGIYALTSHRISNLENKVEFKGKEITEGLRLFNEALPEDYPIIDYVVGKKELIAILNDIKNKYSEEVTKNVLDEIKWKGFKYSTLLGTTLSLDACRIENSKSIRNSLYEGDDTISQLEKVSSNELENILKNNFSYSYLITSGARGSWEQVRQIVMTRGFISNFRGQILATPIKHSLLDGLTQHEFFLSTYGCRKGLLDVSLNTGASGYLSRKLIFTCANLQLHETLNDCGTTDCLDVYVDSLKKAKMLVNKYCKIPGYNKLVLIDPENCEAFVGKTIQVRSPIFCKSEDICHTCYGESFRNMHSKFIGVIAAQSLGECNTQLILRTFHTSGVAKMNKDEQMKQLDIVSDLDSASKLLHLKKEKQYKELISELFRVYNSNRDIYHVHFECVVSQMMWKGNSKWRLLENRDKIVPDYHSVQSVPSKESWLLGLGFSNPKRHILKGIVHRGLYSGIMDKILCGEKL